MSDEKTYSKYIDDKLRKEAMRQDQEFQKEIKTGKATKMVVLLCYQCRNDTKHKITAEGITGDGLGDFYTRLECLVCGS